MNERAERQEETLDEKMEEERHRMEQAIRIAREAETQWMEKCRSDYH